MSSTTTTSYLFGQKRERKRKGKQTRLAQVVDQKLGYMLWTKNWDICWAQVGLGPIRPDSSWARISFFFSPPSSSSFSLIDPTRPMIASRLRA
jgi:hypothetical protein